MFKVLKVGSGAPPIEADTLEISLGKPMRYYKRGEDKINVTEAVTKIMEVVDGTTFVQTKAGLYKIAKYIVEE